LAYGIDTYAHLACVEAKGITYAVIASGIDKLGPQDAKDKARKIIDNGGAVISHFHPGVPARPPYFLHRNRIIAGVSSAVFVVESGYKGGSLNTARHAAEESREVFAAPGNITSEKSIGTNKLIKYGTAQITTEPKDILEAIGLDSSKRVEKKKEIEFNNNEEKLIYEALSLEPIHIDAIPEKTGLEISQILVTLLELEFRGVVRQLPGKLYVLP
jgi:DNA processing protein